MLLDPPRFAWGRLTGHGGWNIVPTQVLEGGSHTEPDGWVPRRALARIRGLLRANWPSALHCVPLTLVRGRNADRETNSIGHSSAPSAAWHRWPAVGQDPRRPSTSEARTIAAQVFARHADTGGAGQDSTASQTHRSRSQCTSSGRIHPQALGSERLTAACSVNDQSG
jgi:hypothetical protein